MEVIDDYPFTKYDENGDFQCETCEKKFFAPGYCDTCFLDLVREDIVKAERERIIALLDNEIENWKAMDRDTAGEQHALRLLRSAIVKGEKV